MQSKGFSVTMVSSDGPEVVSLIEQEQCPHISVPFTRTISPVKDLICLVKLVILFRKHKPDIVHTHTPKAGLLAMWAAWLAGVPVRLHTIAGLPWMETSGAKRSLLHFMEKCTALPANRIYPNSLMLKEFLSQQHIGQKKMKVLGKGSSNGIDCTHFSMNNSLSEEAKRLRTSAEVPEDGWIWIFIGRIVKDKGIGELLDAFSDIHQRYPSDRLWILGNEEPELDPVSPSHRDMLYNHKAIRCWGFQNDIRPFLAASTVLVFPSYREGFPNVPMQAGAMGRMLILSDINGCNEIVEDGVTGRLVPAKNTSELLKAMDITRKDSSATSSMASLIREKIIANYNQQAVWNHILDEYREWMTIKKIQHGIK